MMNTTTTNSNSEPDGPEMIPFWVYIRNHAQTYTRWLEAQKAIDAIYKNMGLPQSGLCILTDVELIFPQVERGFQQRIARQQPEPAHSDGAPRQAILF